MTMQNGFDPIKDRFNRENTCNNRQFDASPNYSGTGTIQHNMLNCIYCTFRNMTIPSFLLIIVNDSIQICEI
jgi:hypothetical protein